MSNSSFKLSALAIACGLALSACSSGGGGDAPSVKPTPTVPGASNPAPGQGGNVETPSSDQNGSSVPTPPGAGGSAGSEPTTPPNHNHHEGSPTGGDTTQPPSADKAYDAAKEKFDKLWGENAQVNDDSARKIDSKDEFLADQKTELEDSTNAYKEAAKKAVEGKYATEADRKAAVKAAEEAKEQAGQYLSRIEGYRKEAEQWKTSAEKALAEAEEMLKAKPDDATAKEYKQKAEALKIRADQFLDKYKAAEAQALKTEAERLVTEANASTVETADTPTTSAPEAGDQNSGDQNSGDQDSGDQDSGDQDSGDQDSGDQDSGDQDSNDQDSDDQDSGSQGGASTHPANPEPSAPAASPLKTGELGEKYFDGEGEITTLVINGKTIDLTVANTQLSRRAPLWTDFDKIITSQGFKNLIYGAAKLADGSYALFVQGKLSDSLPGGTVTYSGDVLHFRSRNLTEGENWFDESNTYRTVGSFTAKVDFAGQSLSGKINSGDGAFMNTQEFTGSLNGNRFTGTWKNGEKGSISGGFYGDSAAEMAGRYSYVKDAPKQASKWTNNGFGVFGGKKTQ